MTQSITCPNPACEGKLWTREQDSLAGTLLYHVECTRLGCYRGPRAHTEVEAWQLHNNMFQAPAIERQLLKELLIEMETPPYQLVADEHSPGWWIGFASATHRWKRRVKHLLSLETAP